MLEDSKYSRDDSEKDTGKGGVSELERGDAVAVGNEVGLDLVTLTQEPIM